MIGENVLVGFDQAGQSRRRGEELLDRANVRMYMLTMCVTTEGRSSETIARTHGQCHLSEYIRAVQGS